MSKKRNELFKTGVAGIRHGAAKDSWFAHLAMEIPAEGASNEWLESVNDEAYGK